MKWPCVFSVLVACALAMGGQAFGDIDEPPQNSFLADSPWPMLHRNPYQQGSSPLAGPTEKGKFEFLRGEAVSIGLLFSSPYKDGSRVLWGNTLKRVSKIDPNGRTWSFIHSYKRKQSIQGAISGAYTVLDREGTYYVPRENTIDAFRDKIKGDPHSSIVKDRTFFIPKNNLLGKRESIVGLSMTYDGWLSFATDLGMVGVLDRSFKTFHWLRLAEGERISNSIAVDEDGGIYVLTSKKMYRVQWDGKKLWIKWSTAYQTNGAQPSGGLGSGSGTTPTLMGTGNQDKFVVIADGQKLMHLVLFWRDKIPEDWSGLPGRDARIAAEVPITFGDSDAKSSFTEQSVLVRGYGAVVVNNQYGKLFKIGKGKFNKATIYFSNASNVAPYGLEKFRWDSRNRVLKSVWSNPGISCPNGVPTMSSASGLIYCIGQRKEIWNLEAIDWDTGDSVFHVPFGSKRARYNSFYAAAQVAPGNSIITGTFGGFLRVGEP